MTYLQFHLVFILPVMALLYWTRPKPLGGMFAVGEWAVRLHSWLIPLVAMVYTTPWDNYLVYKGIWSYPENRVLFRIGYVPFEEYAYFVLMTLLTTLLALRFFHRQAPAAGRPGLRWVGMLVCLGIMAAGVGMLLAGERWLYMGLVLAYFAPVLALHWGFGGDLLWGMRGPLLWTVALSTLYLWFTDWFAIARAGIWQISEVYTTGLKLVGLEVEEMAFFLIVNVVIVQSFTLICHPGMHLRLREWRAKLGAGKRSQVAGRRSNS
jgi:lycopene cyclase domain-containing protein